MFFAILFATFTEDGGTTLSDDRNKRKEEEFIN